MLSSWDYDTDLSDHHLLKWSVPVCRPPPPSGQSFASVASDELRHSMRCSPEVIPVPTWPLDWLFHRRACCNIRQWSRIYSRSPHSSPFGGIRPWFDQKWRQAKSMARLAVLTYRCIHGTAPMYLADELNQPADLGIRTCLRSASTTSLPVCCTRLSTVGDRAFLSLLPVPGTNCHAMSRPHHLLSVFPMPSEDARLPTFFSVTFVQCLRSDSCHYWHSNRSFYLLTYRED